jgi:CBS domain-containing protein
MEGTMDNSQPPNEGLHHLRIQTRRMNAGDGYIYTTRYVSCPVQAKQVPLDECRGCHRFDHEDPEAFVVCRTTPAAGPRHPAMPLRRQTLRGKHLPPIADQTPISSIMIREVVSVAPKCSAQMLARILLQHEISGAPVVDEDWRPLGMVSKTDLVRGLSGAPAERSCRGFLTGTTVEKLMSPLVSVLPEEASISQAAALMVSEQIHRLPVVGPDGRLEGLLTPLDILRWLAIQDGYLPDD